MLTVQDRCQISAGHTYKSVAGHVRHTLTKINPLKFRQRFELGTVFIVKKGSNFLPTSTLNVFQ